MPERRAVRLARRVYAARAGTEPRAVVPERGQANELELLLTFCDLEQMPACRLLVTGVVIAVLAFAARVEAQNVESKYTAFDLSRDFVLLAASNASNALLFQGGSAIQCSVVQTQSSGQMQPSGNTQLPGHTQLSIKYDKACPLFTQGAPSKFTAIVNATNAVCGTGGQGRPDCVGSITYDFAPGIDVRGTYDGKGFELPNEWSITPGNTSGCVAALSDNGWKATNHKFVMTTTQLQSETVPLGLPKQGTVFLHQGTCGEPAVGKPILRMTYTFAQNISGPFPRSMELAYCKGYPNPCKKSDPDVPTPYPKAYVAWVLYIDQATPTATPQITYNPNNYIRVNSFGRVRVRHWKNVTPALSSTGAGAALTIPNESGGAPTERNAPGIGASVLTNDGDALVSEFLVAPRAPGALNLVVKFTDVADLAKPRGEIGAEILVDKAYSGAFRFGLSRVFKLNDIEYVGVQAERDKPFIITKKVAPPQEVVLGLAIYSQIFGQGGRTYFLRNTYSKSHCWVKCPFQWLWRRAGLYVGIGALSYAPNNLDFMKSLHLGIELELMPNLSLAFTTAIRRTPILGGGLFVGDEVSTASVNTSNTYRAGIGLVLNISTDFLKFAAKGGQ